MKVYGKPKERRVYLTTELRKKTIYLLYLWPYPRLGRWGSVRRRRLLLEIGRSGVARSPFKGWEKRCHNLQRRRYGRRWFTLVGGYYRRRSL